MTPKSAKQPPSGQQPDQLNIKLSPERLEVLKAAAFVQGAANLKELVMPVLDGFIDELESDEAVKLAIRGRQVHKARAEGVLTELRTREASSDQ